MAARDPLSQADPLDALYEQDVYELGLMDMPVEGVSGSPYPEDPDVEWSDYVKSALAGGGEMVKGFGWLARTMGVEDVGKAIEETGQNAVDFWNDSMSDQAKEELSKQFVTKNAEGEYEWGNATGETLALMGFGSLLPTAAGMGAGAGIAKTLQLFANPVGRGVLERTAQWGLRARQGTKAYERGRAAQKKLKMIDSIIGIGGFGLGEGAIGGMASGAGVYERVKTQPLENLVSNERWQQVYNSTDENMNELERQNYATETVAREASSEAGWQSGLTTAILGAPAGAFFGRLIGGAARREAQGLARTVGMGALAEMSQEFSQSGTEQLISNLKVAAFDKDLDLFEGVLENAVAGGLVGAPLGAAGAGAEYSGRRKDTGDPLGDMALAAAEAGVEYEQIMDVVGRVARKETQMVTGIKEIRDLINKASEPEDLGDITGQEVSWKTDDGKEVSGTVERRVDAENDDGESVNGWVVRVGDKAVFIADGLPIEVKQAEQGETDGIETPGDGAETPESEVGPAPAGDMSSTPNVDVPAYTPASPDQTPAEPVSAPQQEIDQAAAQSKLEPEPADSMRSPPVKINGLDIVIEAKPGDMRGPNKIKNPYGEIEGTLGRDGDPVDVFLGDDAESDKVFVANIPRHDGPGFEQHKVLMNFPDIETATKAFKSNYISTHTAHQAEVIEMDLAKFQAWVKDGQKNTRLRLDENGDPIEAIDGGTIESFAGNTRVRTRYQLREADDLLTSNNEAGKVDKGYPKALQPRDRTREASEQWLREKSAKGTFTPELLTEGPSLEGGAPLVSPDGIVESGNGRVNLIRLVYGRGGAEYTDYLKANAEKFGLTADQVAGMEKPVLVRVRQDEMTDQERVDLTRAANTASVAGLAPAEQARVDADSIREQLERGMDPNSQMMRAAFLRSLSAEERGKLMTDDGRPTKQVVDRIEAASFALAYDSDNLLALMAEEADPDIKNILRGLVTAAPAFAKARAAGDLGALDVTPIIVEAAEQMRAIKAQGSTVDQWTRQQGLFGDTDPNVVRMIELMQANIRSAKKLGSIFSEMGRFIEQEVLASANQEMFGARPATIADVIDQGAIGNDEAAASQLDMVGEINIPEGPPVNALFSRGGDQTSDLEPSIGQGQQLDIFSPPSAPQPEDASVRILERSVENLKVGELKTNWLDGYDDPARVAHLTREISRKAQEQNLVVVLDKDANLLQVQRHSIGDTNSAPVNRALVLGAALAVPGADSIWLSHNHPSGVSKLSAADIRVTQELVRNAKGTGLRVRGILAIGLDGDVANVLEVPEDSYARSQENQIAGVPIVGPETDQAADLTERSLTGDLASPRPKRIHSITMFRAAVRRAQTSPDGLLLTDVQKRPVAWVPMTVDEMMFMRRSDQSKGAAKLLKAIADSNAMSVNPVVEQGNFDRALKNVESFARDMNMRIYYQMFGDSVQRHKGLGRFGVQYFSRGQDEKLMDEAYEWAPEIGNPTFVQDLPPGIEDYLYDVITEGQRSKNTPELIVKGSKKAQSQFNNAMQEIADELNDDGIKYRRAPPKSLEAIESKLERKPEIYPDPSYMADIIRGMFEVDTPKSFPAILNKLSGKYRVYVEPWKVHPVNYINLTAMVVLPDGRTAELQFDHPLMAEAKFDKGGDQMYSEWRDLPKDSQRAADLSDMMSNLYGEAAEKIVAGPYSQDWLSIPAVGSKFGNLRANSSDEISSPEVNTSAGWEGDQSTPREGTATSAEPSGNMRATPTGDILNSRNPSMPESLPQPSQEDIDQALQDIGHPGPEASADEIVAWAQANAPTDPPGRTRPARFRRTGERVPDGLRPSIGQIRLALARSIRAVQSLVNVQIVQSTSDLPGEAVPSDVEGAWYEGTNNVYLVADNLPTLDRARDVFIHETFGHMGMESQPEFRQVINAVRQLRNRGDKSIQEVAAHVFATQGRLSDIREAKEIIATMAERGVPGPTMGRLRAIARNLLRRMGVNVDYTDDEVNYLIARGMRKYVDSTRERQAVLEGMSGPQRMLEDPDAAFRMIDNALQEIYAAQDVLDQTVRLRNEINALRPHVGNSYEMRRYVESLEAAHDSLVNPTPPRRMRGGMPTDALWSRYSAFEGVSLEDTALDLTQSENQWLQYERMDGRPAMTAPRDTLSSQQRLEYWRKKGLSREQVNIMVELGRSVGFRPMYSRGNVDPVIDTAYASGMSRRRDLSSALASAQPVGVAINELSANGREMIAQAVGLGGKRVFVDSGAFPVYRAAQRGSLPEGTQIDDAQVMKQYRELIDQVASVDPLSLGNLAIVAPDVVGNQWETYKLINSNAVELRKMVEEGVDVIVPLQAGRDSLLKMAQGVQDGLLRGGTLEFEGDTWRIRNTGITRGDEIYAHLDSTTQFTEQRNGRVPKQIATFIPARLLEGLDVMPQPRWGIPSNAAAVDNDEVLEFVREMKPGKLHILGAATPKTAGGRLQMIEDALQGETEVSISMDANMMRSRLAQLPKGKAKAQAITDMLNELSETNQEMTASEFMGPQRPLLSRAGPGQLSEDGQVYTTTMEVINRDTGEKVTAEIEAEWFDYRDHEFLDEGDWLQVVVIATVEGIDDNIGLVNFSQETDRPPESGETPPWRVHTWGIGVEVDPRFRRQGIATAMYDAAEQLTNPAGDKVRVGRGDRQTTDGKGFWDDRQAKGKGLYSRPALENLERSGNRAEATIQTQRGQVTLKLWEEMNNIEIGAFSADGGLVGSADLEPDPDGAYIPTHLGVDDEWQRQGVANGMYDLVEAYGGTVFPSNVQSQDAQAFWRERSRTPRPTMFSRAKAPKLTPIQQAATDWLIENGRRAYVKNMVGQSLDVGTGRQGEGGGVSKSAKLSVNTVNQLIDKGAIEVLNPDARFFDQEVRIPRRPGEQVKADLATATDPEEIRRLQMELPTEAEEREAARGRLGQRRQAQVNQGAEPGDQMALFSRPDVHRKVTIPPFSSNAVYGTWRDNRQYAQRLGVRNWERATDIDVLKNPTQEDVSRFFDQDVGLRWMADESGDVYTWDAGDAVHFQVISGLGLDKNKIPVWPSDDEISPANYGHELKTYSDYMVEIGDERPSLKPLMRDPSLGVKKFKQPAQRPMFSRRVHKARLGTGRNVDYLVNPTAEEVQSVFADAKTVRYANLQDGGRVVWDAADALHYPMRAAIGANMSIKDFDSSDDGMLPREFYTPEAVGYEEAMYSRPKGDPEIERMISQYMATPLEDITVGDRARGLLGNLLGVNPLGVKQGLIDSMASVEALERGNHDGSLLDASESAYKAALATRNLGSVMAAIMKRGAPILKNGSFQIRAGRQAFEDIFKPITQHADGNLLAQWELYAAARRASRLITEKNRDGSSKEKLMSQPDIDRALQLGDQYPEFKAAFKDWNKFNQQILDLAEQAGVLDPEARKVWAKNDYVPFYRAMEAVEYEGGQGPVSGSRLANISNRIRTLQGSDKPLGNVFENMVMNTAYLVDASFRNNAMQKIIREAEMSGAVSPAPAAWQPIDLTGGQIQNALAQAGIKPGQMTPAERQQWVRTFRRVAPAGDNIVSVLVGGKRKYYEVNDPLLLRSVGSLGANEFGGIMNVFRMSKKLLTTAVTIDPAFMMANFIRDTLSTWVVTDNGVPPITGALKGLKAAWAEDDAMLELMMAGAGGSGFYDHNPEQVRRMLAKKMPGAQVAGFMDTVLTPRKMWRFWQKVGSASEQANRVAIYKQVREKGGSVAEGAYQARDVLNFTMSGDYAAMRAIVQMVPFLNARVQGLYRLHRGAVENPIGFAMKGMALTAATLALMLKNQDDDDYNALEDWDKDTYWHFFVGEGEEKEHFRLPKPFEVGAMFATIPERIWRKSTGQDDWNLLKERGLQMVFETLAFNPVPQLVKPVAEQWANRNMFTGGPIVGQNLQYLEPEMQYTPWTSDTMRALAQAMPDSAPEWLRSPRRLEAALRGYTSTTGMYALAAADAITRRAIGAPDRPTQAVQDYPVLRRFWRNPNPRNTKYVSDMYEMLEEANGLHRTLNAYRQQRRLDEAQELLKDSRGKLAARKALNSVAASIRKLNAQQRQIMYSDLDPDTKRARIEEITRRKNSLAKRVSKYSDLF